MSSGRINNKRIESVKEDQQIRGVLRLDKNDVQLERTFPDYSEKQLNKNNLDENFDLIKSLHLILLNCSTLTKKQKFDFCNSQRYFMKLYLKEIIRKSK